MVQLIIQFAPVFKHVCILCKTFNTLIWIKIFKLGCNCVIFFLLFYVSVLTVLEKGWWKTKVNNKCMCDKVRRMDKKKLDGDNYCSVLFGSGKCAFSSCLICCISTLQLLQLHPIQQGLSIYLIYHKYYTITFYQGFINEAFAIFCLFIQIHSLLWYLSHSSVCHVYEWNRTLLEDLFSSLWLLAILNKTHIWEGFVIDLSTLNGLRMLSCFFWMINIIFRNTYIIHMRWDRMRSIIPHTLMCILDSTHLI